ncbi:hypothetical protein ABGT22_03860 [Peribacillus frigoritolerans]|uniref:hypothetical protein n=1 Tax=Peribacillus frigoritolerans TaxID=450367 RepID=UPI00345D4D4C
MSLSAIIKERSELIEEIRSLSADCLPSLFTASGCGVSASQLFGRSVANFFFIPKFMKDKRVFI